MGHILVVDDNAAIRSAIEQILESIGHEVSSVADGPTALDLIRTTTHDAAIIDLRLPGLSGQDILRAMEQDELQIPTIVISGLADDALVNASMRLGAADFLCKPFSASEIISALGRVLPRFSDEMAEQPAPTADLPSLLRQPDRAVAASV